MRELTHAARRLRTTFIWRTLNRLLPLRQRFNALIACFVEPRGLIDVPWGRHWLTIDAAWLKIASTASAPIYQAPRRHNPEFFALVAPMLAACGEGAIVDVGANIGAYVLNSRGVTARPIMAFEPDPATFALLARNVGNNALPDVAIHNAACGDRPGTANFLTGINGEMAETGHDGTIAVPVMRLDDELRGKRIAFIKIDCEGYEWQVLNGCGETIAAWHPALFVELHPKLIARYGHSLADVCDLLRPHYHLEFWELDPAQRSPSRLRRFLSRYRQTLSRYSGEASMLLAASRTQAPDQIFLCATPRDIP